MTTVGLPGEALQAIKPTAPNSSARGIRILRGQKRNLFISPPPCRDCYTLACIKTIKPFYQCASEYSTCHQRLQAPRAIPTKTRLTLHGQGCYNLSNLIPLRRDECDVLVSSVSMQVVFVWMAQGRLSSRLPFSIGGGVDIFSGIPHAPRRTSSWIKMRLSVGYIFEGGA